MSTPQGLTREQIEQYRVHGYVGPFSLGRSFTTAERDRIVEAVTRDPNRFSQQKFEGRNQHLHYEFVYQLASDPLILERVKSLLGPNLLLWISHVLVRKLERERTDFHRDTINLWLGGVHVSVAVTDMKTENGCLQLIPGTHHYNISFMDSARKGLCDLMDSASVLRLVDRLHPENAPHRLIDLELSSGEFFLMRGGVWHGVRSNRSRETRIGLVARYIPPEVRTRHYSYDDSAVIVEKDESLPCILIAGEDKAKVNVLHPPPGGSR